MRSARAAIHLNGATALTLDKSIAKSGSVPASAIGASAVHDNNLGSRCSLPQMSEERLYQQRFVKDRNNDGDLHSSSFRQIVLAIGFAAALAATRYHPIFVFSRL